MENPLPRPAVTPDSEGSLGGCLLRIFWLVLGNAALLLIAVMLLGKEPWTLGWRDVAFWLTVLAVVLARLSDVVIFGGHDPTTRERTTIAQAWRHIGVIAGGSAVLWLAAQSADLW